MIIFLKITTKLNNFKSVQNSLMLQHLFYDFYANKTISVSFITCQNAVYVKLCTEFFTNTQVNFFIKNFY